MAANYSAAAAPWMKDAGRAASAASPRGSVAESSRPSTPGWGNGIKPPRTSIDVMPAVGNVRGPPRVVINEANKESMYHQGCLLLAVRQGDEEEVAHVLKDGRSENIVGALDVKSGMSTLHYAASLGSVNIVTMLLDAGADPQVIDKYGKTPLHLAVQNDHLEVLQLLLEHVQPWMFHVPSKLTLVQTATKYGRLRVVEALLAKGFLAAEKNGEGETALHLAARAGYTDIARVLLNNRAEIHAATLTLGHTPLHYASIGGRTECAVFLVRRGADAHLPDRTPGRRTPVDKCEDCGNRVTLNAILHAAREAREAVKERDEAGRREYRDAQFLVHRLKIEARDLSRDVKQQEQHEQHLIAKHKGIEDKISLIEAARRKAVQRARESKMKSRMKAEGKDPDKKKNKKKNKKKQQQTTGGGEGGGGGDDSESILSATVAATTAPPPKRPGPFLQQQLQLQLQQQQMAGTGGAEEGATGETGGDEDTAMASSSPSGAKTSPFGNLFPTVRQSPAEAEAIAEAAEAAAARRRKDRATFMGHGETRAAAALPRYDNARANAAVARGFTPPTLADTPPVRGMRRAASGGGGGMSLLFGDVGGEGEQQDEEVTFTFEGGRPVANFAAAKPYPREAVRRVDEKTSALTPRVFNAEERKMELELEKAKRGV